MLEMIEKVVNTDTEAARALLHKLIDQLPLTEGDLHFLAVIATAFWGTPPAALFDKLRNSQELESFKLNQPPPSKA